MRDNALQDEVWDSPPQDLMMMMMARRDDDDGSIDEGATVFVTIHIIKVGRGTNKINGY